MLAWMSATASVVSSNRALLVTFLRSSAAWDACMSLMMVHQTKPVATDGACSLLILLLDELCTGMPLRLIHAKQCENIYCHDA